MIDWQRSDTLERELKIAKESMAFCVNQAGGRIVIPDSFVVENFGKLALHVTRDLANQATVFTVEKVESSA